MRVKYSDFNRSCREEFLKHQTPRSQISVSVNFPSRQEEKKILDTVMGSTVYDSRIRPSGMNDTDAATLVTVNLFVRSFSKIDDVKMVRGAIWSKTNVCEKSINENL